MKMIMVMKNAHYSYVCKTKDVNSVWVFKYHIKTRTYYTILFVL